MPRPTHPQRADGSVPGQGHMHNLGAPEQLLRRRPLPGRTEEVSCAAGARRAEQRCAVLCRAVLCLLRCAALHCVMLCNLRLAALAVHTPARLALSAPPALLLFVLQGRFYVRARHSCCSECALRWASRQSQLVTWPRDASAAAAGWHSGQPCQTSLHLLPLMAAMADLLAPPGCHISGLLIIHLCRYTCANPPPPPPSPPPPPPKTDIDAVAACSDAGYSTASCSVGKINAITYA